MILKLLEKKIWGDFSFRKTFYFNVNLNLSLVNLNWVYVLYDFFFRQHFRSVVNTEYYLGFIIRVRSSNVFEYNILQ